MNIEEIRKKAPEGATHYEIDEDEVYYYTKDWMGRWCNDDGCGNWYPLRLSDADDLEKAIKPLNPTI